MPKNPYAAAMRIEAAERARAMRLMEEDAVASAALCTRTAYEDAMRAPAPPPPETLITLGNRAISASDALFMFLNPGAPAPSPQPTSPTPLPPTATATPTPTPTPAPAVRDPLDRGAYHAAPTGDCAYERTGGWRPDRDPHGHLPQVPAHPDHDLPCCPRNADGALNSYYLLSFDEIAEHDFAAPPVLVPRGQWSVDRQEHFIRALAASASVADACAAVGCTRNAAYRLRWHTGSAAFRRAWDAALSRAVRVLADTAFDRAVNGVEEAVWHAGRIVGTRRRYNDALLMFLLRGREVANMDRQAKRSGSAKAVNKTE